MLTHTIYCEIMPVSLILCASLFGGQVFSCTRRSSHCTRCQVCTSEISGIAAPISGGLRLISSFDRVVPNAKARMTAFTVR